MEVVTSGTRFVLMLAVLTHGTFSASDECRDAVAPPTKPRGVNQVDRTSTTPLFELHATPTENHRKQVNYKLSISIEQGKPFSFSEALVAVRSNGTCGAGTFHFNPKDFMEVMQEQGDNCPLLIQTLRRTHMTELHPLAWQPPPCGCVQFRVLIVASGKRPIYYAENEGVTSGPLVKTVCSPSGGIAQITRKQRLDSLCHVIDKHSSGEILSRAQFARQRQLEARWMDRYGLEMALDLRRSDAKICCSEANHEKKMTCFDDVRRRRIDEFCEDGASDIPFRTFRRQHMRRLENSCCFILGEFRYKCFAQNSELPAATRDATPFDFSLDASDVANDLADFGSYQHLDEFLMPKYPLKSGGSLSPGGDIGGMEWEEEEDIDNVGGGENENDDEDDRIKLEEEGEDEDGDANFDGEEDDIDTPKRFPTRKPTTERAPKKKKPSEFPKTVPQTTAFPEYILDTFDNGSSKRLSSAEKMRRRKLKKMQERIDSREGQRRWNGGRRKPARGGRRRKGRRVKAGRQGAMEQSKNHPGGSFQPASSKLERQMFEGRSRSRKMKVQGYVKRRQLMNERVTSFMAPGDDIEGHGQVMEERTLRRLQRKMRRVRLLNECCVTGSQSGWRVYGGLEQVTAECRHSGRKFITIARLSSRISQKCVAQFVECCVEATKKGLTMSSHEFSDWFQWGNSQDYDPVVLEKALAQRGRRVPPMYRPREGTPIQPSGQTEEDYFHANREQFPDDTEYRPDHVAPSDFGHAGRGSFLESKFDGRYPAHHRIPPSPMPAVPEADRVPSQRTAPRQRLESMQVNDSLKQRAKSPQRNESAKEDAEKQAVEQTSKSFGTPERNHGTAEYERNKLEKPSSQPLPEFSKTTPSVQSAENSRKEPLRSGDPRVVDGSVTAEMPVTISENTKRINSTKLLNAVENSTQKSYKAENIKSADGEGKPSSTATSKKMDKTTPAPIVQERLEYVLVLDRAVPGSGGNGGKGKDGHVKEAKKVPDEMNGQGWERGVDQRKGTETKEDGSEVKNGDRKVKGEKEVKGKVSKSKGGKEARDDNEDSGDENEKSTSTKSKLVKTKLHVGKDTTIEKANDEPTKAGNGTEITKSGISRPRNRSQITETGGLRQQPVQTEDEKDTRKGKTISASHRETLKASPANPKAGRGQQTTPNQATSSRSRSHQQRLSARSKQTRSKQRKNKGRKYKKRRKNSRKRLRNRRMFSSGVEALDSREMAERHSRRFSVPLDSREMAEQYDRQPRKNRMPSFRFYTKASKKFAGTGSFWF